MLLLIWIKSEFKVLFFLNLLTSYPYPHEQKYKKPSYYVTIYERLKTDEKHMLLADCSIWMWKKKDSFVVFDKKKNEMKWPPTHKNTPEYNARAASENAHY